MANPRHANDVMRSIGELKERYFPKLRKEEQGKGTVDFDYQKEVRKLIHRHLTDESTRSKNQ